MSSAYQLKSDYKEALHGVKRVLARDDEDTYTICDLKHDIKAVIHDITHFKTEKRRRLENDIRWVMSDWKYEITNNGGIHLTVAVKLRGRTLWIITNYPGVMIGYKGNLYYKYLEQLKELGLKNLRFKEISDRSISFI